MGIPVWLLSMIYKCLEKNLAKRFKNGCELQEFIQLGTIADERKKGIDNLTGEITKPTVDESLLRKEILTLQTRLAKKKNG